MAGLVREKRPRKRATADGAGWTSAGSNRSGSTVWRDVVDAMEGAAGVGDNGVIGGGVDVGGDAVVGESGLLANTATGGSFAVSILERGDAETACTGDIDLSRSVSILALTTAFRPQNDNKPPPVFLPLPAPAACIEASLSFSTTRQPTGKSSWTTSGRDLTDVSHAVEPLEAISCAMGLNRVRGTCLLSRKDSPIDLAVNVLPNGIIVGRIISSGTTRFIKEVLPTAVSMELQGRKRDETTYRPSTTSIPLYRLSMYSSPSKSLATSGSGHKSREVSSHI